MNKNKINYNICCNCSNIIDYDICSICKNNNQFKPIRKGVNIEDIDNRYDHNDYIESN